MIFEKLNEILKDLELAKRDAEKADRGTKAACTRVRKDAMKAIKALDELRKLALAKSKRE